MFFVFSNREDLSTRFLSVIVRSFTLCKSLLFYHCLFILKNAGRRWDEILESQKQNHLMVRVELCTFTICDVELRVCPPKIT